MYEFRPLNIVISSSALLLYLCSLHSDCKDKGGRLAKKRIRVTWSNPFSLTLDSLKEVKSVTIDPGLPYLSIDWRENGWTIK